MKKIIFILLLPFFSFGQENMEYKTRKLYDATLDYENLSSTPDGKFLFSIKQENKHLHIQSFDTETEKLRHNSKEISCRRRNILNMGWYQNRFLCFYIKELSNKSYKIFYQEINIKQGTFKEEEKTLLEIEGKLAENTIKDLDLWGVDANYIIKFTRSNDQSKFLIQYRKYPQKRNDAVNYDLIGMYVFDEALNQIAHNEITMPYTEQQMDNYAYHLTSEGVPYILSNVRNDDSPYNNKGLLDTTKINYYPELLRVDLVNNKLTTTKLKEKGYFLESLKIYDGPNKSIICTGFFVKTIGKFHPRNVNGIALFRVDENGTFQSKTFHDIPLEIINLYEQDSVKKANINQETAHFFHAQMREIIVQKDNSILFIGEQYQPNAMITNATTFSRYGDILAAKININGQLAWIKRIPKNQLYESNSKNINLKYMTSNGNHCFVFMDNIENKRLPLYQKPKQYLHGGNGYLTTYSIDNATGNVHKISLFDTKNMKGDYSIKTISIDNIAPLPTNAFVLKTNINNKKYSVTKVTIK
ncbi:MAG: hypothetical protein ACRBFS_11650 [Aureispira sp.]